MEKPTFEVAKPQRVVGPNQVDFTNGRHCPVVNIVFECQGNILIIKRSSEVSHYPRCWNGVSGYLDDDKTREEKVDGELKEEIKGLRVSHIISVHVASQPISYDDPEVGKTWITYPALVRLRRRPVNLQLGWEGTHYRWVPPAQVGTRYRRIVPDFPEVIEKALLLDVPQ